MPVVENITVYRGEDIELKFTMRPAVDITGWTLSLTVAKAENIAAKVFQVTGTITSGPLGKYSMLIPSATLNIQPDIYAYDVFRTNPGNLRILNVGKFEIKSDARLP